VLEEHGVAGGLEEGVHVLGLLDDVRAFNLGAAAPEFIQRFSVPVVNLEASKV
jgi:hypothetical protein